MKIGAFLFFLILFASCSNEENQNQKVQDRTMVLNEEIQVIDSSKSFSKKNLATNIQENISNSKKINSLLFKESCILLTKIDTNSYINTVFHQYFLTQDLLQFEIASFCKDSVNTSEKLKCIDYLNGKYRILKFDYSDSTSAYNCFICFCKEFRNTQRKIDVFFCLKPGFILFLEGNSINIILINDCSERNQFNLVKEFIKSNISPSNHLISRCGLNIEK